MTDAPAATHDTSNLSWLPVSSSDLTPLASLSICNTNVHTGCDFHNLRKQEEYLKAWANPAPARCRREEVTKPETVIHGDRLGIEVKCKQVV